MPVWQTHIFGSASSPGRLSFTKRRFSKTRGWYKFGQSIFFSGLARLAFDFASGFQRYGEP